MPADNCDPKKVEVILRILDREYPRFVKYDELLEMTKKEVAIDDDEFYEILNLQFLWKRMRGLIWNDQGRTIEDVELLKRWKRDLPLNILISPGGLEYLRSQGISKKAEELEDKIQRVYEEMTKNIANHEAKISEHEGAIESHNARLIEVFGIFVAIFSFVVITANAAVTVRPSSIVELLAIAAVFAVLTAVIIILLLAVRMLIIDRPGLVNGRRLP